MERFVENIKSEAQKQSGVGAHRKEEKLSHKICMVSLKRVGFCF